MTLSHSSVTFLASFWWSYEFDDLDNSSSIEEQDDKVEQESS